MNPRKLLAAVLGTLVSLHAEPARSCGGFPSRDSILITGLPSPKVEKVAIFHDASRGVQHFVREIVFDGAQSTFGFVVPVPARPEVAAVKVSPFGVLEGFLPRDDPPVSREVGDLAGGGGAGEGAVTVPVVIEEKRLGSFAVSVLAASDAAGLSAWLKQNHLAVPDEMVPWLARYVALGFHYVVFRYDPPRDAKAKAVTSETAPVTSEIVRISFPSALPYYPYHEPAWNRENERVLAVWLVGSERAIPVALDASGAAPTWSRPWLEIAPFDDRDRILAAKALGRPLRRAAHAASDIALWSLPEELRDLLPKKAGGKPLSVQVFMDQKTHRRGWGDVLLVPERPLSAPRAAAAVTWAQRIAEGGPVPAGTPSAPFANWTSGRGDWDGLPLVAATGKDRFSEGTYHSLTTKRVYLTPPPPPPPPRPSGPSASASIGEVKMTGGHVGNATRLIAGMEGGFLACYRRVLPKPPRLKNGDPSAKADAIEGKVILTITIRADGKVSDLEVTPEEASQIPDDMLSCIRYLAAHAVFDRPEGRPAVARVPVTFVNQ